MTKRKEASPLCEARNEPCVLAALSQFFPCRILRMWRDKRLGDKETSEGEYIVERALTTECRLTRRRSKKRAMKKP